MSKNSMKNKREIYKEQTYKRLIRSAKYLYSKNGTLETTTKQICDRAKVAHGTLFSHFKTKEKLVQYVFSDIQTDIAKKLNIYANDPHIRLKELLVNYLGMIASHEQLFVVMSSEFPFYSQEVKNEILATETLVRNMIYQKIEQGIEKGEMRKLDITMSLSFLFGTIQYYLSRKDMFVSGNQSVINLKKNGIVDMFFQLLNKD